MIGYRHTLFKLTVTLSPMVQPWTLVYKIIVDSSTNANGRPHLNTSLNGDTTLLQNLKCETYSLTGVVWLQNESDSFQWIKNSATSVTDLEQRTLMSLWIKTNDSNESILFIDSNTFDLQLWNLYAVKNTVEITAELKALQFNLIF